MKQVWEQLFQRLPGEAAVLVTIVESRGSAPRHAGALMAVFEQGSLAGTVGGGKVEAVCLERAARVLVEKADAIEDYDLNDVGKNQLGMACGGSVRVEFAYLPAGEDSVERVRRLADSQPQSRVLLFGAGHVGRALAALLPGLEFGYLVADDRPEFARTEDFPQADAVLCAGVDQVFSQLTVTEEDYIVIMTRGHQHDQEVLRYALATPAGYIGLMGSRRKIAMTRQALEQAGVAPAEFDRVSTPIGLDIGAETPAEIAVSVAAQLIQHRAAWRGKGQKPLGLIHS